MTNTYLLVLVGIPGSGKTTYAIGLCARCPDLVLISPDIIREELYPGYAVGRVDVRHIDDHRVFRIAYGAVAEALEAGRSVLFDATSLTVTRRRRLVTLGHRHGACVRARYFPITLQEAFHRNNLRARQVPTGAIAHMASVLTPPRCEEGFDRVVTHTRPPGRRAA